MTTTTRTTAPATGSSSPAQPAPRMIGGESDLSAGVAVIASALTAALLSHQLSTNSGWA